MGVIGRLSSERAFVTCSYLPDDQSHLSPRSPPGCPHRESSTLPCHVVSNGWRRRKTGPFAWLKLFRCLLHGVGFTVYPIGMTPFARRSFIDAPSFQESAVDAAIGKKWPEFAPQEGSTFKTQKRHILLLSKLFGIAAPQTPAECLAAAVTLKIPTIHLQEAAHKIREGPTYRGRAQVVMGILKLGRGVCTFRDVLRRGHDPKLWGRPIMDERDQVSPFHFIIDDPPPSNLSPA